MQSTSTPSALSRILRLLHHRPRARCTAGGHARLRRCLLRRTTRSRRRSSPRHQRCPRSPHSQTRRAFRRRFRRTSQWPLGLLQQASGWGCTCPRHEHGRRRLFVEREPRAAPPHAGCCAPGRLRQRSRQLLRSIGAPPLAHSVARCPAARRSSAGTMEPGESWAGQWPLQRRRVRGAHSWRILFFRGGARCAGAFYAPVRQPPAAEVGDAG